MPSQRGRRCVAVECMRPCASDVIDVLLRNTDLHGSYRPQQFADLGERLDGCQQSCLGAILTLLDPTLLPWCALREHLDGPELGLVDLQITDGDALHQELFQGCWTQTAQLPFESLKLLGEHFLGNQVFASQNLDPGSFHLAA